MMYKYLLVLLLPISGYAQMNSSDSSRFAEITKKLESIKKEIQKAIWQDELKRRDAWVHEDLDSAERCLQRRELEKGFNILEEAKYQNEKCIEICISLRKFEADEKKR